MKVQAVRNNKREIVGYQFYCLGCKHYHMFYTYNPGGPQWKFDNNMDNPTFTPSLLVNNDLSNKSAPRCHLFVTNGVINYLSDCTHELAGQNIKMQNDD